MLVERLILERVGPFEHLDLEFREGRDPLQADVHMLVGPNGCGKSTILYALAQLCSWQHSSPIWPRRWGPDSVLALRREGEWSRIGQPNDGRMDWHSPDGPLEGAHASGGKRVFGSPANTFVVAYSGYRQPSSNRLGAIGEPPEPAPAAAVGFGNPDTNLLKQWIGSQKAKAAWALARKDEALALQREATIRQLERALENVTGCRVEFVLEEDPIEILLSVDGRLLDFNVLPDGLKSVISWLGDLLMRLEHARTDGGIEVTNQPFVLLLDEIEVHLHPAWQRRVVPAIQGLFPNAQVVIATHSPFVVASADDAWVYPFRLDERGLAICEDPLPSQLGHSYGEVLQEIFGITSDFDPDTQQKLEQLIALRDRALVGENVSGELDALADVLANRSTLLSSIVGRELRVVARASRRST